MNRRGVWRPGCRLRVLVLIFALGVPTASRASLVTYTFGGIEDYVDAPLAGTFSIGQVLGGAYTFDSTTSARAGSDSTFAVFDALTSLQFTLGAYAASSTGAPEIQVDNDPPGPFSDRYAVLSRAVDGLTGPAAGGFFLDAFVIRLDDSSNSVFSDALILPTSLSLADFDSRRFFLFFSTADTVAIVTGVMTVLAVPEPSTLFSAGVGGLCSLIFCRAWRQRKGAASRTRA